MAQEREMQSKKLSGNKPSVSTQKYLDISEIRDNVVVLRDGTMRAVLLCSSINFSLKSEDEQDAIISAYVQFLNSIDFPIEILVQSRRLNIDNYLAQLQEREQKQTNELLKIQIAEYRAYVKELLELGEIMNKKFFVVVPYNPVSQKGKRFFSRITEAFKLAAQIRLQAEQFMRYKAQLMRRVDLVASGLSSMGLSIVMLDTQSLIELYYNSYNPKTSLIQKMPAIDKIKLSPEI